MIKKHFKKLREIWDRIIKMIGINNVKDFVKNAIDDADEFIMVDVHKNTNFDKSSNSDELVIVLHSVIDNDLKTSLIQAKTRFSYLPIFNKFKTKNRSINIYFFICNDLSESSSESLSESSYESESSSASINLDVCIFILCLHSSK